MGVSQGLAKVWIADRSDGMSPYAILCQGLFGQIRVTPSAPSGYPLWHPIGPFLPYGGEDRVQGIRGTLIPPIWALTRARACIQGLGLLCYTPGPTPE